MVTFVLIEDNHLQLLKLKEIVNKAMMGNERIYKIREFKDATKELYDLIKDGDTNKVYVIDFELPSTTAIEIAREIRRFDWTSIIIVNSAYGTLAFETFKQRLQILDFVSKQFDFEKNLIELFDICLNQFDLKKPLVIKKRSSEIRVYPQHVLYFYRNENRKIVIVTNDESFEITSTLHNIQELFNNRFVQVHKSCYINMERIKKIDWKYCEIEFDNKAKCTLVSEHYKNEVEKYEYR